MLHFFEKEGIQYEYASVQFRVTGAEDYFNSLQAYIPDDALYHGYEPLEGVSGPIPDMRDKYGREDSPHVTVLYGIDPKVTVADVRRALPSMYLPDFVRVSRISTFESSPKYNVVKVDVVEPEQLWRINAALKKLPLPGETFPDYRPHMTLAYVRKDWKLPVDRVAVPAVLHGYFEFSNNGAAVKL